MRRKKKRKGIEISGRITRETAARQLNCLEPKAHRGAVASMQSAWRPLAATGRAQHSGGDSARVDGHCEMLENCINLLRISYGGPIGSPEKSSDPFVFPSHKSIVRLLWDNTKPL